MTRSLLGASDPPAVTVLNPDGRGRFVLIGDHAGNRIPAALGDLGLPAAERDRHIGWDIGIAALGHALSPLIDAPFVAQTYSRLVIDCNRDPAAASAMPETSDGTAVPANRALTDAARDERVRAIHAPYHARIAALLDARPHAVLIALHSFTPALADGAARPWHVGILHGGGDETLSQALLGRLRRRGDLIVGDNEPYAMEGTDYSVPHHAFGRGIAYAEIEIRQDLLAADPERWAAILADDLRAID